MTINVLSLHYDNVSAGGHAYPHGHFSYQCSTFARHTCISSLMSSVLHVLIVLTFTDLMVMEIDGLALSEYLCRYLPKDNEREFDRALYVF